MKVFSILFAIAALFTGLIGAYYWLRSSKVPIKRWGDEPLPPPEGLPPQELLDRMTKMNTLYLGGMFEAAHETARLNKIAAIWTAVAVVLGAASSVVSSHP